MNHCEEEGKKKRIAEVKKRSRVCGKEDATMETRETRIDERDSKSDLITLKSDFIVLLNSKSYFPNRRLLDS